MKARTLFSQIEAEAEAKRIANLQIRPSLLSTSLYLLIASAVIILILINNGCKPGSVRDNLDKLNGTISEHLERRSV